MAISIQFNTINVNAQNTNSAIIIGQNAQNGWSAQSKNNYGTGPSFGRNIVNAARVYVFDPDVIESQMSAPGNNPTLQNQHL